MTDIPEAKFIEDPQGALKEAENGPVFIKNDKLVTHVLITSWEYEYITGINPNYDDGDNSGEMIAELERAMKAAELSFELEDIGNMFIRWLRCLDPIPVTVVEFEIARMGYPHRDETNAKIRAHRSPPSEPT